MTLLHQASIDVIGLPRCTGCFGCESACTRNAIVMLLDGDGFYKPIVDREMCNECGTCQRYCPVIQADKNTLNAENKIEPIAFAAWANDEQVRLASSSGGVFSELAKEVLESGGMVAGCVWGDNWTPMHILTNSWADVEKMRGSKYVPSKAGNIYRQVIDFLRDSDNKVLFSGTPCQVASMEAALSPKQRGRVLLVDFICHGVPSLRVFHRYIEELFDGDEVASYTFRDKSFGWQTVLAVSADGKRHHIPASADAFFQGFAVHHLYVMDSCYQCQFARLSRESDITLGDFWGCPEQWYDKRGVSLVLANTDAGLDAFYSLDRAKVINLRPVDLSIVIAKNKRVFVGNSYRIPEKRRAFFDGLKRNKKFTDLKNKYFPTRSYLFFLSFLNSKAKMRFIADFLLSRFSVLFLLKRIS